MAINEANVRPAAGAVQPDYRGGSRRGVLGPERFLRAGTRGGAFLETESRVVGDLMMTGILAKAGLNQDVIAEVR
jgi:hypothetical protein